MSAAPRSDVIAEAMKSTLEETIKLGFSPQEVVALAMTIAAFAIDYTTNSRNEQSDVLRFAMGVHAILKDEYAQRTKVKP